MSILSKLILPLSLTLSLIPSLAQARPGRTDAYREEIASRAALNLLEHKGYDFMPASSYIDVKLLKRGPGVRYVARTGGGVGDFVVKGKLLRGSTATAKIVSRSNISSASVNRMYNRAR